MNVTGARLDRLLQQRVDEPDDGSAFLVRVEQVLGLVNDFRGQILQVFLAETFGHILGGVRAIEYLIDAAQDVSPGGEHGLAARARIDQTQVVERISE